MSAIAFSPDSTFLVSSAFKAVHFHDSKSGILKERIDCDFSRISSLAFDPSGKFLAAGGGTPGVDGIGLLLEWKTKSVIRRFTNFHDLVTGVAFHPQENLLAMVSADGSAFIQSWRPGEESKTMNLAGHSGPILTVNFSPDGQLLVTGSADRSIKVWSATEGKMLRSFGHHTETVHAVAFKPWKTGPLECASGSSDQTVRIWQPAIGRMVRIIRNHEGPVYALTYHPDGASLFSAGKEGLVRRLDSGSDEILGRWKCHDEPIYSMAISPDGTTLATGDWAGKLSLWNVSGTNLVSRIK